MPMTWRPALWPDIEESLLIQPRKLGAASVGPKAAWRLIAGDQFFNSALIQSDPPIRGHRLIGLGAAVFVADAFVNRELRDPRPDINSRIMAAVAFRNPVLATRDDIANGNAGEGLNVVVIGGFWKDSILSITQRREVQILLPSSFAECLSGYRIRQILYESVDEPEKKFVDNSIVFTPIAEFPQEGRVIHLMTSESASLVPGSLANVIFSYKEPLLRLRESDQQLLLAALTGAIDSELAVSLNISLSAVKARWRSVYSRLAEIMPDLVGVESSAGERGPQIRHVVLAYVRAHPEELRPYAWSDTHRLRSQQASLGH